jgi:hypothetical protein
MVEYGVPLLESGLTFVSIIKPDSGMDTNECALQQSRDDLLSNVNNAEKLGRPKPDFGHLGRITNSVR